MLLNRDPAHYLKPLKSNTLPKRLLWLDCHSESKPEQGLLVERWHHATLGTTHYTSRKGERVDTSKLYDNAADMWQAVDAFCTPNRRVVLWAYDLGFQLRVSRCLVELPKLGWHLDKIVLERTASWALLRNGEKSLMCCDLKSWSTVDLRTLDGDLSGTGNLAVLTAPLDRLDDALTKRNITVIRESVLQILTWLEGENLGPFRPTGSGQSYAGFRRRFLHHDLLVHDDMLRIQAERVAMWTGRCEAWRHGKLTDGPYYEYDMQAAYCRIVSECHVPSIAIGIIDNPSHVQVQRYIDQHAVMAEVDIDTDIPCIPTTLGNRTVWPVGKFSSVIWDPEIRLALTYANDVTFKRIYLYKRAPALQEFAEWTLDGMNGPIDKYGPIPRRVLKHWSRCLVGRLGLRYRSWERFGTQDTADLRLVTYIDTDEGTSTDMLIAGHDRLILADMAEAMESLPQIPGWVMSECRRRLWQAMVDVGLSRVVYCDTDSFVFKPGMAKDGTHAHRDKLKRYWTRKGNYSAMMIHGPRNLVCETDRRIAGLPLSARQVAPLEFSGQVMRSIKESMRAGELDCVASIPRKFVLDAPDLRRQHMPNGATAPFRVNRTTEG